ncbi:single-stranded-DNA-specific exonuclease RecJ [Paenibacillus sp. GSMTC-2017]|uniref:single-stranded-DNA-specific exonuclease RecJ n=1 Tax=Paenibacillus sp. GSMTC-2017 TaxID=2794350 RepID=UPI0018D87618|nr:single-stranded-DNA-specific exonuclease RecJ [Paenibacillus sp. GSMTC-2017]MBH5317121.1 single-stranded-DNA-specific exonuclease RecJ [Paenibacillus sp. GSMTC-2017]
MIHRKTRWDVAPWADPEERDASRLSEEIGLPPLVAKLLVQRGFREQSSARQFLYGGEEHLHDPYLLHGMKVAVKRFQSAIENGEKVRIYGDYDADGVSSTSLLVHVFREMKLDFDYYIPHRAIEGYGLNNDAITKAADAGVKLLVTVDTGISAYTQVEYANSLGIDVIVTDHHEPPEVLPNACAIINPKQAHCNYPFKGLAGVGVAFKLASALLDRPPLEFTDIVSLGTIADLMPLADENRILVRYGLDRIRSDASIGFRALAEVTGIELESITSSSIAFGMGPRVNAAGRLDHARRAVEMLTTPDYDVAILEAIGLDNLNKERQRIVETIVQEAEERWQAKLQIAATSGNDSPAVILLGAEGWNVGVIGIVASKLLERHYKPVIIFGIDEKTGKCKGSARSIEGFDLHAALTRCEDLLDHYGGHQAAAGMTLHRDHLEQLEARMSQLALEWLSDDDWIPRSAIDIQCSLEDASLETITQLSLLEPFGIGNRSPRFLFEGMELADKRAIGKEAKHLKLALGSGRKLLDVIAFGKGELAATLHKGCAIDIVGELSINEWNGAKKPQLMLHDLHYEPAPLPIFPSREQFGSVYQQLRRIGQAPLLGLSERLAQQIGLTADAVRLMLDVFEELKFIEITGSNFQAVPSPEKRELTSSKHYCTAKERTDRFNVLH